MSGHSVDLDKLRVALRRMKVLAAARQVGNAEQKAALRRLAARERRR